MISAAHMRLAHSEDGFTLVELLVGMMTGFIVVGAALMILEVSLTQSSRISDRVQADQVGRTAMSKVVEELRTTCLAKGFTPVQEKSTSKELVFRDAASDESLIKSLKPAPEAYEDHIFMKGSTLIDERRASTGGELPSEFTYSKTATKTLTLATNVTQSVNEKKEVQPLFRYYEYAPTVHAGTTSTGVSGLEEVKLAEGKELGVSAKEVSSVSVNFSVAAEDNYAANSRLVSFENQVTFAFGLPASETKIEDGPCE